MAPNQQVKTKNTTTTTNIFTTMLNQVKSIRNHCNTLVKHHTWAHLEIVVPPQKVRTATTIFFVAKICNSFTLEAHAATFKFVFEVMKMYLFILPFTHV